MIASLPMYWRAETADLWQAFWRVVQAASDVPLPELTPPEDLPEDWTAHWLSPDLALSMTCGLPFRTALRGKVTYVGTLDFGLGGPEGHYFSNVIARHIDAAQGDPLRLAYNAPDSQSGWAVTQYAAPFDAPPTPSAFVQTGAHAASLMAVACGEADIAYIDAVTWRLLAQYATEADRVQVIGKSIVSPGLPLITAKGSDPAPLRAALQDACRTFGPANPMAMGGPLRFVILEEADYLDQPLPVPPPLH